MKPTVFFSYSRQDSEFALQLGRDLRAAGIPIWLDQLDIAPGERWDATIEKALASCSRILVILSPASVESTNVMDEVSYALEENKKVIPVLYRDCELPFRLRRLQHTDFRTDYSSGLEKLVRHLNLAGAADATANRDATSSGSAGDRGSKRTRLWAGVAAAIALSGAWVALRGSRPATDVGQTSAGQAGAAATPPESKPAPKVERDAPPPVRRIGNEPRVRIVNVKSRLCLTVAGGVSKDPNIQMVQYPCDADPSRYWSTQVVPDTEMLTLRNYHTELCLTVAGGSTEPDLPAVQYFCDGDPSRNWILKRVAGSTYRIVNEHSQLCLGITGGATDRNAVANQAPCDGDPTRQWQIRREPL